VQLISKFKDLLGEPTSLKNCYKYSIYIDRSIFCEPNVLYYKTYESSILISNERLTLMYVV
jgi:hypothetical protein